MTIPFPLLHIGTGYKFPEMIEFPRPFLRGQRPPTYCSPVAGTPRRAGRSVPFGDAEVLRPAEDERLARCDPSTWIQCRDPRSAPRRGKVPLNSSTPFATRMVNGTPEINALRVEPFHQRSHGRPNHARVSLSNWTELDVWAYILAEQIPVVRFISRSLAR